jgi:choline dehydrogenase-like flavoprotein
MANQKKKYDVIVVGSGAAGGCAAKELCEAGLEVLVLEAGRQVDPAKDFNTHQWPYQHKYRGRFGPGVREKTQWNQYTADGFTSHLYILDTEHPYTTPPGKPYVWVRSRLVGGKMLHWGRNARRLSNYDFKAADRDGFGENWPIGYEDLAPYYDKLEEFVGVCASREGLPQLPDGKYLPPMALNCGEVMLKEAAPALGLGMRVIPKRHAQRPTSPYGLGQCHYCGTCDMGRGCDTNGYWNSIGDTLWAAQKTGRLRLRPDSVVYQVLLDKNEGNRVRGVSVIDRLTRRLEEVEGRVVVLGASALESTRILLNSTSRHWPNGLANSSGVLGHYLMDNIGGPSVEGFLPELMGREVVNEDGKAGGIDIVAYRNIQERHPRFIRSYTHEGVTGAQLFPGYATSVPGFGKEFKRKVKSCYTAWFALNTRGEMLARWENFVEIDRNVVDVWGIPVLRIHCQHSDNDREMAKDAAVNLRALAEAVKAEGIQVRTGLDTPGMIIHDMGTARMGADPKKSVLNRWNQAHDVSNLFVVDGACFVTSGGYGPTLTIGALAMRASAYLVEQLKRGEL